MTGCLDRQTEIEGGQSQRHLVFMYACAHAASLCRRLKLKLRGEEEARRERKCRGKPLTAVAQGSGFLCRCRKTTVSEVSRKSSGILSRFCLRGHRPGEQVPTPTPHMGREEWREKKNTHTHTLPQISTTVWHCFY